MWALPYRVTMSKSYLRPEELDGAIQKRTRQTSLQIQKQLMQKSPNQSKLVCSWKKINVRVAGRKPRRDVKP